MVRSALARLGLAATGILYLALGAAATHVAMLGAPGRGAGMPAALRLLLRQPHGRILIASVAAGLLAFAIWHLIESRGPRRSAVQRAGHLAGAAGYAALAASAAALWMRLRLPDGALRRTALEWLLSSRAGVAAVEAVGVATIGAGLYEILQGATGRLRDRFATAWLPRDAARFLRGVARFGLSARGVVLVVIGIFQVRVALELDPRELREIGGALNAMSRSPAAGPLWAAVVGVGLMAYGFYMVVLAAAGRR